MSCLEYRQSQIANVIKCAGLPTAPRQVLLQILLTSVERSVEKKRGRKQIVWCPSSLVIDRKELARKCGLSSRTVQRAYSLLVKLAAIEIEHWSTKDLTEFADQFSGARSLLTRPGGPPARIGVVNFGSYSQLLEKGRLDEEDLALVRQASRSQQTV